MCSVTQAHSSLPHGAVASASSASYSAASLFSRRHAYATLQLEDDEELAVISPMLGHSNFSTTANVYAHLTASTLRRSADRMDAILVRTS